VVGPNGAGKSTLLKTFCGDLTPTLGTVRLEGKPLREWRALAQARKRAVLPQESSLNFPFTVQEVVLMGRSPHVRTTEQPLDYRIAREALGRVAMWPLAERDYATLSGGEKQRVQLARVLAQIWEVSETGQRYLLLDEPTNNLDLAHQHHTLAIAKAMSQEGVGVLAILHDLNLAAQYADRIALLCRGSLAGVGQPHEVFTRERISEVFALPVLVTKHPCLDCPLIVSAQGIAKQGVSKKGVSKQGVSAQTSEVKATKFVS
jgi:iron complex transport system ATP-binding protein